MKETPQIYIKDGFTAYEVTVPIDTERFWRKIYLKPDHLTEKKRIERILKDYRKETK